MQIEYVSKANQLEACIRSCAEQSVIGIDLEFDRDRYAYGFTLCLIQISCGEVAWIIDPFMLDNLEALYRFLERELPKKIFHAPGEDLTLLQLKGCKPRNIFDTERSARLLNQEFFSLNNLLQHYLGKDLDKSQQKTDWIKRPLSNQQLEYAANDVLFLPQLYRQMMEDALQSEVLSFIEDENRALDSFTIESKPEGWLASKGDEKKYPPYFLYLYNALLVERDQRARGLNKPGYMLVAKEILVDLVFNPSLFEAWDGFRGLHPSLRNHAAKCAFKEVYYRAQSDAEQKQLSKYPENYALSPLEKRKRWEERTQKEERVETLLRPISKEWGRRYGKFASSYMLNERMMLEVASGKLNLMYPYREALLKQTAIELKIDLSWLNTQLR
jgi:ribonuclease D